MSICLEGRQCACVGILFNPLPEILSSSLGAHHRGWAEDFQGLPGYKNVSPGASWWGRFPSSRNTIVSCTRRYMKWTRREVQLEARTRHSSTGNATSLASQGNDIQYVCVSIWGGGWGGYLPGTPFPLHVVPGDGSPATPLPGPHRIQGSIHAGTFIPCASGPHPPSEFHRHLRSGLQCSGRYDRICLPSSLHL